MTSAPPLEEFLNGARTALRKAASEKERATLVVGDENADLDSIASAIVFSYLRTAFPPPTAWSPIYIPLLNIERAALSDREVLMRLLPHAKVTLENLITLDDMHHSGTGSTESGLAEKDTRFFLVDHNVLLGRQKQNYSKLVSGCIDHHQDGGYVPQETDPEPRIVGKAGSCTSLVVNYSRRAWETLDWSDKRTSEEQLAKLALAAILVDTTNLEDITIVSQEDIDAVAFLQGRLGSDFDRNAFYAEITGQQREVVEEPVPEPIAVEEIVVVESEPIIIEEPPIIVEPEPIIIEEVVVLEEPPVVEPEPIIEEPAVIEELIVDEPLIEEPIIEEPATKEVSQPVFEDLSPVALAQADVYATPPSTPPPAPFTPPPTSPSALYKPSYLPDILAQDFQLIKTPHGAILGISHTSTPLASLVIQAERDLVNKAIAEATSGATTSPTTAGVMQGTPFTHSVREFALERGVSVYAISTATAEVSFGFGLRKELFIWVLDPKLGYFIPWFVQAHHEDLELENWGEDDHTIVLESGMSEGMMEAFNLQNKKVGREELVDLLAQGTGQPVMWG